MGLMDWGNLYKIKNLLIIEYYILIINLNTTLILNNNNHIKKINKINLYIGL